MASTMGENGEGIVERSSDLGIVKVNGEVNGSFEEPMEEDVTDVISSKKLTSDINCVSEVKNDEGERQDGNTDIEMEDPDASNEVVTEGEGAVPNSEVPEAEHSSSNGFRDNQNEESPQPCEDNGHDSEVDQKLDRESPSQARSILSTNSLQITAVSVDSKGSDTEKNCDYSQSDHSVVTVEPHDLKSGRENLSDPLGHTPTSDPLRISECDESKHDGKPSITITKLNSSSDVRGESNSLTPGCEKSDSLEEKNSFVTDTKADDIKDEDKPEDLSEKNKVEDDGSESTPDKGKKPRKSQSTPINITPRRSSRNLNKQKSYVEKEDYITDDGELKPINKKPVEDPDIEEITPTDPLAADPLPSDPYDKAKNSKKTTIVVNDTKRLVEIAASKQSKGGKKEPTLVIIDTNSILSGRGPVPVSSSPPIPHPIPGPSSRNQGYSMLPVALPAQGMYPSMKAHPQIKPVVLNSQQPVPPPPIPPQQAPPQPPKPPIILPSLTDDMYVVEAPSFIVPYVYEKPPIKPLREFVVQLEQAVKEEEKLERERKEKQEKEEQELKMKEEKKETEDKDIKNETKTDADAESKVDDRKETTSDENKMDVDSEEIEKGPVSEKADSIAKDVDKNEEIKTAESVKVTEKEKSETPEEVKQVVDETNEGEKSKKYQSNSYFDNPLGKFFMQIGVNLVQEHVQTDLLRSQKRKRDRDGNKCTPEVHMAITSLIRTLEFSKENNEPFRLEQKKCEFCSFKTESALVMAHHLETPHMRNYVYRCNFCPLEVRSPHDILFHMEAEHNVRGRLERAPAFHQCPSCPFEDNQKGKLTRHLLSCAKKYRPERNQEPPLDFEPPAKIPRISRNRPSMAPGNAVYQAAMSGLKQGATHPLLPKLVPAPAPTIGQSLLNRGRGRPQMINRYMGDMRNPASALAAQQKAMAQMRPSMLYRPSGTNAQPQVLLPTSYQLTGNQIYQSSSASNSKQPATSSSSSGGAGAAAKLLQQPSISITPLPRQQPAPTPSPTPSHGKPGRPLGSGKATFVICEICDGYIKDLEQLRNHMQWIHKVKIHPKMIYNRPPLNCQKCQFRFFTDQGLERHLLGSHGLVTSSMQEAANKGKDGGRCPVCGRVYQWKLLNHVARDHNVSLKPAHLSYKCTVCTATFGMYKQFENHVYSAHSVVAKRVMEKKPPQSPSQPSTSSQSGDSLLKPLKINDEITIIPQPARSKTKPGPSSRPVTAKGKV